MDTDDDTMSYEEAYNQLFMQLTQLVRDERSAVSTTLQYAVSAAAAIASESDVSESERADTLLLIHEVSFDFLTTWFKGMLK